MKTETINTQTRREYAQLLRRFLAGKLTTDAYEDQFEAISRRFGLDDAVDDIFQQVWFLHDDIVPHQMIGSYRLSTKGRKHIARCILFLRSDLPYQTTGSGVGAKGCLAVSVVAISLIALIAWRARAIDHALSSVIFAGIAALQIIWVKCIHTSRVRNNETKCLDRNLVEGESTEPRLWPFLDEQDLNAACQVPIFLFGGRDMRLQAH